ncbi:unnamed protein product [Malus baccata var. baccata]
MGCKQPSFSSKRGGQARKCGISFPERRNPKKEDDGVIARLALSQIIFRGKQAANYATSITKKLMKSTRKAQANILGAAPPQKQVEPGRVESETSIMVLFSI